MKKTVLLFIVSFLLLKSAHAIASLPSVGTCAFLISLPVPYGLVDVSKYGATGYNFMGTLTFTSATSGQLSGIFENAVYKTNDSPGFGPSALIKDAAVSIAAMTDLNGFAGGSKLMVSGTATMSGTRQQFTMVMNAVATNNGNTIMLQFSGTTPGPGSGVCQF